MKKIILNLLFAVVALGATAQINVWDGGKPSRSVTFGARLGVDVGNLNVDGFDTKAGVFGGLAAEINIVNSFSVNSGLFFSQKGCRINESAYDEDFGDAGVKARVTANFIELPVYASYRLHINPANMIQVYLGPYFDFGIYGKATAEVNVGGEKIKLSEGIFNGDNGFRRFQVGLAIGAAYTWRQFSLGICFQGGLTDVAKDVDAEWNTFNISLGYNF